MNEHDTRRHLEAWDPAAGVEAPSEELYGQIRSRLAGAAAPAGRRQEGGRLGGRRLAAAVAVAGTLLVAATLTTLLRLENARAGAPDRGVAATETADAEPAPVQVVYTASNGVRIYWTVPAKDPSRL